MADESMAKSIPYISRYCSRVDHKPRKSMVGGNLSWGSTPFDRSTHSGQPVNSNPTCAIRSTPLLYSMTIESECGYNRFHTESL